jgi:pimeloyl-ACP methyl ester carboxylesterase
LKLSIAEITRRQAVKGLAGFAALSGSCLFDRADSQPIRRDGSIPQANAKHAPWLTLPPTPSLPITTRSGLAKVNGTSLFYAQFGDGAQVLLLHGGLANSNYWGYQVKDLARNYAVTVMDTRGHGRSPVTANSFGYGIFAADVSSLLDFLEISKTAVVGWSDGAVTGLQLAMNEPDRVSRLFAFGGNASLDGVKENGGRSRVFESFVDRCRTEYAALSPHPERWQQLVEGLRVMWRTEPNFDRQMLARVRVPTTISDGEYDEIIRRDHLERVAHEIPGARLVMQPEVSHFAMLQNPSQFNRALNEFLLVQN